jgi:hypothetical protein
MPFFWTPPKRERLLTLQADGYSYSDIARQLSKEFREPVTVKNISYQLHSIRKGADDSEMPSPRDPWDEDQDAKLIEYFDKKMAWDEIASLLNDEFGTNRTPDAVKTRRYALAQLPAAAPPASSNRPSAWTDEHIKEAYESLGAGKTYEETAQALTARFGIPRTEKGVLQKMHSLRSQVKKAAKKTKKKGQSDRADIVRATEAPLQVTAIRGSQKNGVAVIPEGRSISVNYPTGEMRVVLHGEIPISALRGLAEVLVGAAIS